MNKPFPALCRDCKYHVVTSMTRCLHPKVIADNAKALTRSADSNKKFPGVDAAMERDRWMFAPCGQAGKLWDSLRGDK